jgi:AcrR family transcriptional regulator
MARSATTPDAARPDPARPRREGRPDKIAAKRAELAAAALTTLAELGYARTSLREIAQNSPYSHGVVHYYFDDKVDLITECVRMYKAECVKRYDGVVLDSRTAAQLRAGFAAELATTLVDDAALHRLWYDLRSQAMFESSFLADVRAIDASLESMIWRVVSRFAELSDRRLSVSPAYAYGVMDGLFQQALLRHGFGDDTVPATLTADAAAALDQLLAAGPR